MSFEENVLTYCSCTLAAIKAGSLFTCFIKQFPNVEKLVQDFDKKYRIKGLRARILQKKDAYALVYLYRPSMLNKKLEQTRVRQLLQQYGYDQCICEAALDHLEQRMKDSVEFPHEIGVFLDYPIEDVESFIHQRGENCLFCGVWKVYHRPEEAEKCFHRFRQCLTFMSIQFQKSHSLASLVVDF